MAKLSISVLRRRLHTDRIVRCALLTLSAAGSLMTAPADAGADERGAFSFGTGFDYTSGTYGTTQDTTIWYVPFIFKYMYFPWTAKLTVPYLELTGPGGVTVADGQPLSLGTGGGTRTTETGVGDMVAALMYSLDAPAPYLPLIDLTGKVKFPTADETRGLGTGSYDGAVQVDLSKSFGQFTPLATLAYKFKGDAPGVKLDNVFYASLGAAYKFNDQWSGGGFIDYQEAATKTSDDQLEFSPYVTWKLHRHWALTGYGLVGIKDGSPDEGAGLQLTYKQ